MLMKGKLQMKFFAWVKDGLVLCDEQGEREQELKKPLVMNADDGLGTDVELTADAGLTPEQVADFVHQGNAGRAGVFIVTLAD